MNKIVFYLLVLLLLPVLGCGYGGKVPLKGRITFSDDGAPLITGFVIFSTPTFQARGEIQSDGTFQVSSEGTNDGLPSGEYDVHIVNASIPKPGSDPDNPEAWLFLVDEKYDSAKTSGLKLKVDSKTKNYDLVIDKYVEKRKNKK